MRVKLLNKSPRSDMAAAFPPPAIIVLSNLAVLQLQQLEHSVKMEKSPLRLSECQPTHFPAFWTP